MHRNHFVNRDAQSLRLCYPFVGLLRHLVHDSPRLCPLFRRRHCRVRRRAWRCARLGRRRFGFGAVVKKIPVPFRVGHYIRPIFVVRVNPDLCSLNEIVHRPKNGVVAEFPRSTCIGIRSERSYFQRHVNVSLRWNDFELALGWGKDPKPLNVRGAFGPFCELRVVFGRLCLRGSKRGNSGSGSI